MYQIIYENESVGYTEKPVYIKNKDGVYINVPAEEAEGIAINSTPYIGAFAREIDVSTVIKEQNAQLEQTITDLEIAQIEDEQMLTDHDIAIMELQAKEA